MRSGRRRRAAGVAWIWPATRARSSTGDARAARPIDLAALPPHPSPMSRHHLAVVVLPLLSFACAGGGEEPFCELPGELPTVDDVEDGKGAASRDGASWSETASWSATTATVTIGLLDIIVDKDEEGASVRGLFEDGTYPICVRIGERSESVGQANYVEGGFVSDGSHEGSISLLANEDGILVGRFSFSLANPGGTEMTFEDGVFRATER